MNSDRKLIFRYRLSLGSFILGLIVSGLTAFPLELETALLNRLFGIHQGINPTSIFFKVRLFTSVVHYAIHDTYTRFPFFWLRNRLAGLWSLCYRRVLHLAICRFSSIPGDLARRFNRVRRRHCSCVDQRSDPRHSTFLDSHRLQRRNRRRNSTPLLPATHPQDRQQTVEAAVLPGQARSTASATTRQSSAVGR